MPNQTIDLWRGLEAWYDFDPRYYDAQRGVLADKSGHGRHAQASGGPTVGVEGPASFEATSFDGSDDWFDTKVTIPNKNGGFSISVLLYPTSNAGDVAYNTDEDDSGYAIRSNGGHFNFYNADGSTTSINANSPRENEWELVTAIWDGSEMFLHHGRELQGTTLQSQYNASDETHYGEYIGTNSVKNQVFKGRIAFFGWWNRAISYAEVLYLNNLTAPPRSL